MSGSELAILGGKPAVDEPVPDYRTIDERERDAALRVLETGLLSDFYGSDHPRFYGGPEIRAFEAEWCAAFGCRHAVSVNSNTSGLIAAMAACGVGPGDEVLVVPMTMSASATAIQILGGVPVFVDIRDDLYTMDVADAARKITERTKAIMVVNLFGQAADLAELMALARPRGIRVVEDNAQAPWSRYRDRWAGTVSDIGVFSLNCHKQIQTGEGGVCCTEDADLAYRLQLIRNHGEAVIASRRAKGGVEPYGSVLGYNFRMTELSAAIGREQLKKLPGLIAARQEIAADYADRTGDLDGLVLPLVGPDRTHSYYTYTLRIDPAAVPVSRDAIVRALDAEGVPCDAGYMLPLYCYPAFGGDGDADRAAAARVGCPTVERLYRDELFLHVLIYPQMRSLVPKVAEAFRKVWDNLHRLPRQAAA